MKIQVIPFDETTKKIVELQDHAKVEDLLKKLELLPDEILVTRQEIPIPLDEELNDCIKMIGEEK